jgi:hypothetical protein
MGITLSPQLCKFNQCDIIIIISYHTDVKTLKVNHMIEIVIGIDPGLSGGIAIVQRETVNHITLLDTIKLGTLYKEFHNYNLINFIRLIDSISPYYNRFDLDRVTVIIEKQTVMFGGGRGSGHDTGKTVVTTQTNYGILLALAQHMNDLGHNVELVHPATWTMYTGNKKLPELITSEDLPKTAKPSKARSANYVANRLGLHNVPRKRNNNVDDGLADAIALALYYIDKENENENT